MRLFQSLLRSAKKLLKEIILILLSIPSVLDFHGAPRLTTPDREYPFGEMSPGGVSTQLATLVNPTGADIHFTVALGGTPPTGATVSADQSVVPANSMIGTLITVTLPADEADADGVYNFSVDISN